MSYKCPFGCTSYNSLCDGCDSATTSDSPYDSVEKDKELFEAAKQGLNLEDYLEFGEIDDY